MLRENAWAWKTSTWLTWRKARFHLSVCIPVRPNGVSVSRSNQEYSPQPWPLIWINSLTSREENMPATFVISWERKMSVVVQYVVRPNPGTDPAKITELAKEGAVLWRKHGGKVTYWTVAVGEVGNRVLSITFENFAAYGAAVDKMGEDKEVRAWQAKRMKAGYTTWVRSNMATEIEI